MQVWSPGLRHWPRLVAWLTSLLAQLRLESLSTFSSHHVRDKNSLVLLVLVDRNVSFRFGYIGSTHFDIAQERVELPLIAIHSCSIIMLNQPVFARHVEHWTILSISGGVSRRHSSGVSNCHSSGSLTSAFRNKLSIHTVMPTYLTFLCVHEC